MKFQANDHQALKEIADEIILFEGIQHENLVRYHGVEIHKVNLINQGNHLLLACVEYKISVSIFSVKCKKKCL